MCLEHHNDVCLEHHNDVCLSVKCGWHSQLTVFCLTNTNRAMSYSGACNHWFYFLAIIHILFASLSLFLQLLEEVLCGTLAILSLENSNISIAVYFGGEFVAFVYYIL